jgi:RsiW-degrading membrane proteinase PrsW (M82 family)
VKEYASINMKPIFIIIVVFIFVGIVLETTSIETALDNNAFLKSLFILVSISGSVLLSYFFLKDKTGQRFSWKLLLISILFSIIFIALALMKKLID